MGHLSHLNVSVWVPLLLVSDVGGGDDDSEEEVVFIWEVEVLLQEESGEADCFERTIVLIPWSGWIEEVDGVPEPSDSKEPRGGAGKKDEVNAEGGRENRMMGSDQWVSEGPGREMEHLSHQMPGNPEAEKGCRSKLRCWSGAAPLFDASSHCPWSRNVCDNQQLCKGRKYRNCVSSHASSSS